MFSLSNRLRDIRDRGPLGLPSLSKEEDATLTEAADRIEAANALAAAVEDYYDFTMPYEGRKDALNAAFIAYRKAQNAQSEGYS